MVLLHTPSVELNKQACDFSLLGVDGKTWSRDNCRGEYGLLVMFICNHCPYVKAIVKRLVEDVKVIQKMGVGVVAIMPNDPFDYPDDSFEHMKKIAETAGFTFPYIWDETQEIAKSYGAICTPDFFGFNRDMKLQYRGRLDASNKEAAPPGALRELVSAMQLIADTGKGPDIQIPSMGCSIKWREDDLRS